MNLNFFCKTKLGTVQVNALRAIQQIHQQLEGEHNGVEVPVAPVAPVPAVPALPSTEKEDKEDKDDEDTIAAAKRKDFEDHKNNERLLNIFFFSLKKTCNVGNSYFRSLLFFFIDCMP